MIGRRMLLVVLATCMALAGSAAPAASAKKPAGARPALSAAARTYKSESDRDLRGARASLKAMLEVKGSRNITNTLEPYNDVETYLDRLVATAQLMEQVHPDSQVRSAAQLAEQQGSKLATEISTDPRVYRAIKAVDVSHQDAPTRFWIFKELRSFRRAGVDKDDATRAYIRGLNERLVRATQTYDRNLSEDKSTIQLDTMDLAGLPEDYVKGHPAGKDGKVTLTMAYPDYIPYITYAKNAQRREEYLKLYLNRAYPANVAALDSMLVLRQALAYVLGYSNYANYVAEVQMIGSDTAAEHFVERVTKAADKRMHDDYDQLLARKRKDDPSATRVDYWDNYYYTELLKGEKYNYSSQEVRPYFEYNRVKQGVLSTTSKMFGVRFVRATHAPVWHPSVEAYDVYDGKRRLGRFFLDMHPRADKYSHAANFSMQSGVRGRQIPMATLVCNFPESRNGEPGLLEHDDVETFFHEFGHLLHHIFGGDQRWVANSGISTESDFVEAPSQMLEEWVWDAPTVQTFARHYKTGQPVPAELIQRMRSARDWSNGGSGKGIYVRQQMFYAAVSLYFHERDPRKLDTTKEVEELQARYSPWQYVPDTHMQAGFTHLSGYASSYYTYMWSLVIAKDLFTAFSSHPLVSPVVATRYRHDVLERGGSAPAAQLVSHFLGRPYSTDAFEGWLNEK